MQEEECGVPSLGLGQGHPFTVSQTMTSVNILPVLALPFSKPDFETFKIVCSEDVFLPLRHYTQSSQVYFA